VGLFYTAAEPTWGVNSVIDQLVPVKRICKHSKPWINKDNADQIKRQRRAKRRWKKRRGPKNYAVYEESVRITEKMFTKAKELV